MFSFYPYSLLTAKQTNISAVVIGCRGDNAHCKTLDTRLDLDNKEYSFTLENNREKKTKAKERMRYASPATALFAKILVV